MDRFHPVQHIERKTSKRLHVVQERSTEVKATLRPDHTWPEVWSNSSQKQRGLLKSRSSTMLVMHHVQSHQAHIQQLPPPDHEHPLQPSHTLAPVGSFGRLAAQSQLVGYEPKGFMTVVSGTANSTPRGRSVWSGFPSCCSRFEKQVASAFRALSTGKPVHSSQKKGNLVGHALHVMGILKGDIFAADVEELNFFWTRQKFIMLEDSTPREFSCHNKETNSHSRAQVEQLSWQAEVKKSEHPSHVEIHPTQAEN